jgi:hypothetical protein
VHESTDVSDGALSLMGPYITGADSPTDPDTFRARHERSGLVSGWTSDSL